MNRVTMNMRARQLLEDELSGPLASVTEATVRLPPRSTRWVAVYSGAEPGQQIARSTGLTDREAALRLARKWEAEARAIRQSRKVAKAARTSFALTQAETALLLNISERAVRAIEKRALRKLRRHPALRDLWREYEPCLSEVSPGVDEGARGLTPEEIEALLGLAKTPIERQALRRVLGLVLWKG